MKHRNYDVIVAWAEGKTVQVRYGPIWHDVLNKIDTPNFNDEKAEWRVSDRNAAPRRGARHRRDYCHWRSAANA